MTARDEKNKYTVILDDSSLEAVAANNFLKSLKRKKGKFLMALVIWFLTHTESFFYDESTNKIYSLQEGRDALKQMLPDYTDNDIDKLPIEVVYNLIKTNEKAKQGRKSKAEPKVQKKSEERESLRQKKETVEEISKPNTIMHQESMVTEESEDEDDSWMLNMVSTK